MAQKRTAARFEQWKLEATNIEAFFDLMERAEKPLRFRDACFSIGVPYTLMHAHMKATPEVKARYYAILAARSDELVHESLDDAEAAHDRDSAAVAKVKFDAKRWVASKWDKELYGEQATDSAQGVPGDRALLSFASELLKLVKQPEPRVVDGEMLPEQLPQKVARG